MRDDFRPYERLADSAFDQYRRLDRRTQIAVAALLLALLIIALAVYYEWERQARERPAPAENVASPNLFLGNPSAATLDPADRDNFLMVKPYYVLSYNSDNGTPNWVSWRVTIADLGDAPRKPEFDPDMSLPAGFNVVTMHDYSRSGFDRGHMCPHSDRNANVEMSYATFVMTNIIPQAPNVNRKAWEQEEEYLRELVRQEHQRLYVMAGPAGRGGRGSTGFAEAIGRGKVTVPAQCWKIAVSVPDEGYDDPTEITPTTRVITVLMPNDQEIVGEEWEQFRTTPAEVEQQTGMHFFQQLSPAVAAALRQERDTRRIPPPRPHGRSGGEW